MRKLGLKKGELERAPRISDMLARAYGKVGEGHTNQTGNAKQSIEDLRFSQDPVAVRFLATWDALPAAGRKHLPIEAVCLKAGVSPQEFLGHVFLMRQSLGKAESSLVAVNAFPDVVRSMVEFAAKPGGENDRRMLAQHTAIGFLPNPKGATVSVNLFNNDARFGGGEDSDQDDDDAVFNATFSGKNSDLEEWSESRRALLSDGK